MIPARTDCFRENFGVTFTSPLVLELIHVARRSPQRTRHHTSPSRLSRATRTETHQSAGGIGPSGEEALGGGDAEPIGTEDAKAEVLRMPLREPEELELLIEIGGERLRFSGKIERLPK